MPGLVIIAARPSIGKTALACNWSNAVCRSGGSVLFVSLEVGDTQIRNRIVSAECSLPYGKFRSGLGKNGLKLVRNGLVSLRNWKLEVLDGARYTVADIRNQAKRLQATKGLNLVVIDYLQLIKPDSKKDCREQQVAEMSRNLKLLAKELRVPVLLLAQLNRDSVKTGREPTLSDLRESGAIEQDADVIILLHSKSFDTENERPTRCIIGKGRSSGTGKADLLFYGAIQRFEDDFTGAYARANDKSTASGFRG